MSDADDADDVSMDDWIEEDASAVGCPLCSAELPSVPDSLNHMNTVHHFDLVAVAKSLGLDFYERIRLVNYLRKQTKNVASFDVSLLSASASVWRNDDSLLVPVVEQDPLLYALDVDDEDDDDVIPRFNEAVDLNSNQKIQDLERQLAEVKAAFSGYKDMVRKTFLEEPTIGLPSAVSRKPDDETNWSMDYYFGSYAETEIHEVMLKDAVRTESYRDCFYLNKDFFKDKIVLDVGCGTGILSMFAAKSGAKHVYAVDNSTIILKAKEIVQRNGLSDKITFIRGEVEHIQLPVETVDCIVSEWMGYFLLFEGMFDSVITARDRWLAPDGIMAPSYANIQIAGLEDADWVNDKYHFWNDVYGFDYSCMKGTFLDDGQVDIARKDSIISEPFVITELALDSITPPELDFKTPFTLKFTKKARLHALCGWFDIRFDFPAPGATPVFFSTGPAATPTHWKQTTFVLDGALDVDTGSVLEGVFECKKSKENARELEVVVEYVVPASGEKKRQTFTVR